MNDFIIFFFIIILILVGYKLIFNLRTCYNKVPKKIWTYIENPDRITTSISQSINSWKKINPEYEVIILTKKTYKGYITIPASIRNHPIFSQDSLRFQHLISLWILYEHGGIWIDPSIIVKKHFDSWLFPKYGEFSGYSLHNNIQSSFMACNKNSEFIKQVTYEFIQIANYPSIEKYIQSRKDMGIQYNSIDELYFTILISFQKVLQYDKYPIDKIIVKNKEEILHFLTF